MNDSTPSPERLLDLSVGELLARLGSEAPTPGGGAVAALAGALGAALVQMTANLTLGRPRLADVQEQARDIADRAAASCQRLAHLGEADAGAYAEVAAAYKLPRGDEAEKAARARAIQTALQGAAQVPLETAREASQVLRLAEEAVPLLNAAVISDVMVGAVLAEAALRCAAINVEINLASLTDRAIAERFEVELGQAQAGAADRAARVLDVGRSRFPGR